MNFSFGAHDPHTSVAEFSNAFDVDMRVASVWRIVIKQNENFKNADYFNQMLPRAVRNQLKRLSL